MDGLLVFAALVILAIPLSIVALFIGQSGLRTRLNAAEEKISALQNALRNAGKVEQTLPEESKEPVAKSETVEVAEEPVALPAAKAPPVPQTPPAAVAQRASAPVVQSAPRPPSPIAKALADFGPWLQENWFYAVSAASLALAGIFLVQYGMENGLLPPRARVAAALAFGAALIGVGEFIRRRFGDGVQSVTAYLPSVFSGAGIVTLFGGILSARMLYDLIGGGAAMGGMVIVALIAVVLGWMHGPLLVAVGVIGAYAAPMVLESSNTDASPLFGFFAIVAVLGLGVDTVRRWG